MPERLPYDEAMLFSPARLKVQDPEIKEGRVEMIKVQTKLGVMERPWGVEGGFAVVYKFRTRSGHYRALRCFRVPMEADMQFRYEHIGPYFHAHANAITAGFKYHDPGIVVKEQGKSGTYPLIEMDWINGVVLVDKVDELCRKRDRTTLRKLSEQWISLLALMRTAHIAHGDLAGPNIMVRADGRLVLIDYDGVYIPSFAGKAPILLGQPDYQHPQMAQRKFDEYMDAFSALVISVALMALSLQPELWRTYSVYEKGKLLDTNLLFKQKDFLDDQQSSLFRALENLDDQRLKDMVQELRRACTLPVERVRFPFHLFPSHEYDKMQTLTQLKQAIAINDYQQVVKLWTPEQANSKEAQPLYNSVQLAQWQVNTLAQWREVLKKGNIAQIVASYDALLDTNTQVTSFERDLLTQARIFLHAYKANNDDALLATVDTLLRLSNAAGSAHITFTEQEEQYIKQARQRKQDLQQVRDALQSNRLVTIAAAYTAFLRVQSSRSSQECRVMELAHNFLQAYQKDDDAALFAAFDAIQHSIYHAQIQLSELEKQRLARARLAEEQRIEQIQRAEKMRDQLRTALASKRLAIIVAAYEPILDQGLTPEEKEHIALAQVFLRAHDDQNDEALIRTYERIQALSCRDWLLLTQEEEQYVEQARWRHKVLDAFQRALASRQPRQIAMVYCDKDNEPLLSTSKQVSASERGLAQLACAFMQSFASQDDGGLLAAWDRLQQSPHKDALVFAQDEQHYIEEIRTKREALQDFIAILESKSAIEIVAAYKQLPIELTVLLTREQQEMVRAAQREFVQQSRLKKILVTTHELKDISAIILKSGKRKQERYTLIVRWRWPEEEQIRDAIIIYSPSGEPPVFGEIQEVSYPYFPVWRRQKVQQEEISVDSSYAGRENASLFLRICILMRDDREATTVNMSSRKHYLSRGITGCISIPQ